MPEGVVTGGWSFVIVAYGITAAGLIAYIVSLLTRRRHLDRESSRRNS